MPKVSARRGVNVKAMSKRLGHADITTTLKQYVHFMPEIDEEASNIIGGNYVIKRVLKPCQRDKNRG